MSSFSRHDRWIAPPVSGGKPPVLLRRWVTVTPAYERDTSTNHTSVTRKEAVTRLGESITPDSVTVWSQTVTRLCIGCGKPLTGKRPQAKTHGAACRQRAYRLRLKASALAVNATPAAVAAQAAVAR